MSRIKWIGLMLVAALAIGVVAAAPAMAEEGPEITNKEGKSPTKDGFTLTSGKTTIEAVGGAKITCTSDSGSGRGDFDSPTSEVTIKFLGCEAALGGKCKTGGAAEGELSIKLVMRLKYTNRAKDEIAYLFSLGNSSSTIEFKCGAVVVDQNGSFLVPVLPVKTLQVKYTFPAHQKKGVQELQEYEIKSGETAKDSLEWSVNGAAKEKAGIESEEKVTYEEEVQFG